MKRTSIFAGFLAVLFAVVYATAAEETLKSHDRERVLVQTGEADIDASAADYTSSQALLTIDPTDGHAMRDVVILLDLDKTTTGLNTVQAATTGQFAVSRKVDGSNWRKDIASITTFSHGTNTSGASFRFDVGTVSATEQVRVEVLVSAEGGDVEVPYAVTYRSPVSATFTAVAN